MADSNKKSLEEVLKELQQEDEVATRQGLNLSGGGTKSKDATVIGGRVGYGLTITDKDSVEIGASGHYAKGKDWKDSGVDRGDITYERKLGKDSALRATLGGGKKGIDSGFVGYEAEFKKGGKVKAPKVRGHGVEKKGKTKGRFI